jgi:hypothetical protein
MRPDTALPLFFPMIFKIIMLYRSKAKNTRRRGFRLFNPDLTNIFHSQLFKQIKRAKLKKIIMWKRAFTKRGHNLF